MINELTLPYEEARTKIKDGMIVFFEAVKLNQKILAAPLRGNYSHCAFTVWFTDDLGNRRLLLAESSHGGCRLVNFRSYAGRPCKIVDVGLDWSLVVDGVTDKMGAVPYSTLDLLHIGFKEVMLKWGLKNIADLVGNSAGEVCSEFVANTLSQVNRWHGLESLVSPVRLDKLLAKDVKETIHVTWP